MTRWTTGVGLSWPVPDRGCRPVGCCCDRPCNPRAGGVVRFPVGIGTARHLRSREPEIKRSVTLYLR